RRMGAGEGAQRRQSLVPDEGGVADEAALGKEGGLVRAHREEHGGDRQRQPRSMAEQTLRGGGAPQSFQLLQGARPILPQQAGKRAVGQQLPARLTRGAVV